MRELSKAKLFEILAPLSANIIESNASLVDGKITDHLVYDELSAVDQYVMDVFEFSMLINHTYEKLCNIETYLSEFPRPRDYAKNGITKSKYIEYHLENYYIRISTILDQLAILTGAVFSLGIPAKKCTPETILENTHTKNTRVAKLLKEFKKAIKGIKQTRNLIIHRGQYDDDELNELETYFFVSKMGYTISPSLLEYMSKDLLIKKRAELEKNNDTVASFITTFYDTLTVEFTKQHSMLLTT